MTKPLEQIAYEAFRAEVGGVNLQAWDSIANSPIHARAWKAVARAVASAVTDALIADQRAKLDAIQKGDPSRPVKCGECGARTLSDEKHVCVKPCPGCKKLVAMGEKHECGRA